MQRAAILPDRDEEGILFRGRTRTRAGDLTRLGETASRLLPPVQILIVLVGAPAELLLILVGDGFTILVGGGAPLRQLRALAVFEVIYPAGVGSHRSQVFTFGVNSVSRQHRGRDLGCFQV